MLLERKMSWGFPSAGVLLFFSLLSFASCRNSMLPDTEPPPSSLDSKIGVGMENDEVTVMKEEECKACKSDPTIIDRLPGQPSVNFVMRSGYIPVNEEGESERALFYWFVAASNSSDKAPLSLWLTGGPGCSSVGYGAFIEIGPFYPNTNGTSLHVNEYAWNEVSNFIFLESPAGVGFSYITDLSDIYVGDKRTAEDTWRFLVRFYQAYPEFEDRPFYITGESYAGHYIPQLAETIVEKNKNSSNVRIPLIGFAVGNPWSDLDSDNSGIIEYWGSRNLISEDTYRAILKYCQASLYPLAKESKKAKSTSKKQTPSPSNSSNSNPPSAYDQTSTYDYTKCSNFLDKAYSQMGYSLIDQYDIYSDVCSTPGSSKYSFQMMSRTTRLMANNQIHLLKRSLLQTSEQDPCIENEVEKYLNLPQVQAAFHVSNASSSTWVGCTDQISYSYSDFASSVIHLYPKLMREGLRIWVYSGDLDSVVPVTGTLKWLAKLNLTVVNPWRPWTVCGQVGGYVTEYENLTFTTVRGAGHMVPYTQPDRGLYLFATFLSGQSL